MHNTSKTQLKLALWTLSAISRMLRGLSDEIMQTPSCNRGGLSSKASVPSSCPLHPLEFKLII